MNKVVLSSIINIISGGTPSTKKSEYWDGDIGWLSVTDFNNDIRYVYDSEKKITNIGVKESNTKFLKKGDIIISARGTVGALAQIGRPMCFNQSCFGIRGKEGIVNTDFLYYALKNYVKNIVKRSQGSVFNTINLASFNLMELELPSNINDQTKIAKVLSSLDSKIEINNKINAKLEAMAKLIYDYWFVQFDFPDANGKPYKSSGGEMVYNEELKRDIPVGWEVKAISNFIEVKDGTHDSPKPQLKGYPLITSKNLKSKGLDYENANLISEKDYININKRSKVETGDILFSMIGSIGVIYKVEEKDINFAIKNVALYKTSQQQKHKNYIYLNLKSDDMKRYMGNVISGSIQKFIGLTSLRNMPLLLNEKVIQEFEKKTEHIFHKLENLKQENKKLAELKDWLLPMLMNGQVSVG